MASDFTFKKYEELCLSLYRNEYVPLRVCDFISNKKKIHRKMAIIRHDVDRRPNNALYMAELEYHMGICSTYYFRYPNTFKPEILKRIVDWGHEVGYHYEVLSKTKGDCSKAIELFEKELKNFQKIGEIRTISMHGSPLSKFDNRALWLTCNYEDFGIIGDASLSLKDVGYFTDTGRNWNSQCNIRDFIPNSTARCAVTSTDDLIRFLNTTNGGSIYLNIHPNRWAVTGTQVIPNYIEDTVFKIGKRFIIAVNEVKKSIL